MKNRMRPDGWWRSRHIRALNGTRSGGAVGGFTLAEVMVVIVIIGIMAGLVLPALTLIRRHMYAVGTRFEISQLDSACRQFRLDVRCYPPDMYSSNAGAQCDVNVTPPVLHVGGVWGGDLTKNTAIPRGSSYMNTYSASSGGSRPTPSATSPQLKEGVTSICLVFWLGSVFTIDGKSYGPYYSFDPKQLQSTGQTYSPAGGVDSISVGAASLTRRWQVQGIDLSQFNLTRRVVPIAKTLSAASQASLPMFKYYDKFGVLKVNDPTNNKNYYIYDSYSPRGAWVNWVMHNNWEFDVFSYGADGLSVLDSVADSRTENQAAINELTATGITGDNQKRFLGNIADDINNWAESYRAQTLKKN